MRKREENQTRTKADPAVLRSIAPRVLALAYPYRWTLALGFIALVFASGINLLFPYLIRQILNGELGLSLEHDLTLIAGGLILLFAIQSGFFYIRHYTFQAVGYRAVAAVRKMLFQAIIEQDIAYFDSARIGDLLSRLSSDTQLVQRAVTINISVALRYAIQVLGGTMLMFYISPQLTTIIIVLIPLVVLSSIYWGRRLRKLSKEMQHEFGQASASAEETIGAVRTVRIFSTTERESSRYGSKIDDALQLGIARARFAAIFASTMVFMMNSSIAVVLWYGGLLIVDQQLTLGDVTAFLLYGVIVATSFGFLAGVWDEFMQAVGAAERIFEVVDRPSRIVSPGNPVHLSNGAAASVEFDNVTFAYPGRPDVVVLNKISFSIEAGQTVAFVGPSGSGKSTIAALIPRFYDPQHGRILFAGQDIKSLSLEELRSHISMVAQDPQVFSVSIADNIRYARPNATMQDIAAAAEAANIMDFIESLPEKYNTLVGERGVQLSGGQRQRVAIARALLKDPSFLILDEATSALDSENEALVQQALERLMENRTTLIIAHRLSTVQHADKVVVIRRGAIEQCGEHRTLVEQPGLYQTLVEHQLL
ncbi:MAG: ATP-binding cassette domain-containing protein [Bdellovibrionales bacterium]|nr:ATP-binding cassette domain-containing protein [Bdellovibrionales bacterium]